MFAEISAAVQSLRVLSDLVKANHSLRNFNELVAAVSEVNAKFMEAQSVVLASQEKQAALANRIGELEKEIVELKDWSREAERYQLAEIASGVFAYRLKPDMENGEPPHLLCTNCFTKRERSILQCVSTPAESPVYRCPQCKNEIYIFAIRKTRRMVTKKHWLAY